MLKLLNSSSLCSLDCNLFVYFQGVRGGFRVLAVFGEEGGLHDKKSVWDNIFDVEDPRSKMPQCKGKFLDVNQALEVARYDIQYCDWRARQDVLTIMLLHEKVLYFLLHMLLFMAMIDYLLGNIGGDLLIL